MMGMKELAAMRDHKHMSVERREMLKALVMRMNRLTIDQGLELIEALESADNYAAKCERRADVARGLQRLAEAEVKRAHDFIREEDSWDEFDDEEEDEEYVAEAEMSATSVREINAGVS
jgi:hypothetical protein